MLIRDATADDWPAIWAFLREIVAAGETFPYDQDMDEARARAMWLLDAPARTVVAVDLDGTVLGSAKMNPNYDGPGGHVASASFMVDPAHWGEGAGRALSEHALEWARSQGYRAMQFNAVAESNTPAVALYRSLGFQVLATIPKGSGTRQRVSSASWSCTATLRVPLLRVPSAARTVAICGEPSPAGVNRCRIGAQPRVDGGKTSRGDRARAGCAGDRASPWPGGDGHGASLLGHARGRRGRLPARPGDPAHEGADHRTRRSSCRGCGP